MKLLSGSVLFAFLIVLAACTPSQQTTDTKSDQEQEIYVFDDVGTSDTTAAIVEPPSMIDEDTTVVETPVADGEKFIVQVGAFTSLERAQTFVDANQSKINWKMSISYSEIVKLYVVQLPPFGTRSEAEYVRNQLWQTNSFNDAFIVP